VESGADIDGSADVEDKIQDDGNAGCDVAADGDADGGLGGVQVDRVRCAGSESSVQLHVELKVVLKLELDGNPWQGLEVKIEVDVDRGKLDLVVFVKVTISDEIDDDIVDLVHCALHSFEYCVENNLGRIPHLICDLGGVVRDGVAEAALHCQRGGRNAFDVAFLADDLNIGGTFGGSSLSLARSG